jgi:hypothetical protein
MAEKGNARVASVAYQARHVQKSRRAESRTVTSRGTCFWGHAPPPNIGEGDKMAMMEEMTCRDPAPCGCEAVRCGKKIADALSGAVQRTTPIALSSREEKTGAGEGIRTLDPDLGKVVLYP